MKRSKHSLSHYKLLSCKMGELVPISCFEALPGDSIQQATSMFMRVSPLLTPVMHPVSTRIHHFFVPYRILWDGWEDFITGGEDGEGGSAGVYPTISSGGSGFTAGALADYLGIPPGVANLAVSALPFRAYNLIFNEYYRDQDLVTERALTTASGTDSTTVVTLANVAWEKDYFTSSRPWPQKGPDVTLPLGSTAPVVTNNQTIRINGNNAGNGNMVLAADAQPVYRLGIAGAGAGSVGDVKFGNQTGLQADLSTATAASVNDLRLAMALQRYQEARARYGSRYVEYLRYLGVRSSDARLQRPEYLGGGKATISFSEVLQTGVDSSDEGVGNLRGHGVAALRTRRYRRFFEEHGVVISLLSVRPRTMYGNELNRMWSKTTKEDYWQKELEHIGQQEVYRRELYAQSDASGGNTVFGYQDRYDEYRRIPSSIAGDFRSTLNDWHYARLFGSAPALNSSFVTADPTSRVYAEQTEDHLWIMTQHQIHARRLVTNNATPSIF
uniref:Putative capsid VP1 n=1 Tax=uncultured virus TaxID=340016 RepID=A0A1D8MKA5_9VIRU|nr:putative capsid VP1 [uncultured virus]